jgi:hypothetical protein
MGKPRILSSFVYTTARIPDYLEGESQVSVLVGWTNDELPLADGTEGGSTARQVPEKKLKKLSQKEDILALSIWGMVDVKKSLLFHLFGD